MRIRIGIMIGMRKGQVKRLALCLELLLDVNDLGKALI